MIIAREQRLTAPPAWEPHAEQSESHGDSQRLEVQLLASTEQFAGLEREWDSLLQQSSRPNIFLTWEWIWTWWEVFGEGRKPWVLVARDTTRGELVGVAPFFLWRNPLHHGPFRELAFMGTTIAAGDHLDILARAGEEESVASRFAEVLLAQRRRWDVLALDRMAAESPLVRQLHERNSHPTMVWESACPYLALPQRWDDLLSSLTRNARRGLKKLINRLEREMPVQYQRVRRVEDLPEAFSHLFRLHQTLWNARGESGAFCSPQVRRFHQLVAPRLLARDWLRMYLLKAAGQVIAVDYDFRLGSTVFLYQGGYDRQWAAHSPGSVLNAHVIRSAIEEGASEIDFLRGEEPYKAHWTHTARRDKRVRLATTAVGAMLVRAYRMLYAVRRKYRAWREGDQGLARFDAASAPPSEDVGES